MNIVFEQIAGILDQQLLTEKIFIVPSHRDGQLAVQALAKRGKAVINVKIKTFRELASDAVSEIIDKKEITELTNEASKQLILQIFKQLKQEKKLNYFKDVQLTPTFVEAIYQGILDLKKAKVDSRSFPFAAFLKKAKANDLFELFTMYEQKKAQYNLVDIADIFELASQQEVGQEEKLYILFPHEAYDLVEKEFFLHYTKHSQVKTIVLPEVAGVEAPAPIIEGEARVVTKSPFQFVYDSKNCVELPKAELTTAINEDEELKAIFRKVKEEAIPFDKLAIYYTSKSPYVEASLRLMEKEQIPITFAEGFPIGFSKTGKLIKGYFRWIRDNYSVVSLTKLIREGCLKTPLNGERVIKLLQDSEIHWGKERYDLKIGEKITELKAKMTGEKEKYEAVLNDYRKLQKWIRQFLALVPVDNGWEIINYQRWIVSLKELISSYGYVFEGLDAAVQEQVLSKLEEEAVDLVGEISFREALQYSEQWLLGMSVGASMPKPGFAHLSPHRIGLYVDRPYMFIVGVDNSRLPGKQKEDPILLDIERKAIHKEMTLGKEYVKRNFYLFMQLLLAAEGTVHISYPFMDTVENRRTAPAHIYLQLYRLLNGDETITGEGLATELKKQVHVIQQDTDKMLSLHEWWALQIWQNKKAETELLNEENFSNIKQSNIAKGARASSSFTEFDGYVESIGKEHDPRNNEEMILSASKLELLGTCPYAYFLRHILHVEEEKEQEYHLYKWLDPAKRGSVLHDVFERFYQSLMEERQKPELEKHLDVIISICDELLMEERSSNPPPSEIVFELERQELIESCSLFLRAEEEASGEGEPLYFEYSFGLAGQAPALINLEIGKTIHLSGKIDRVDKAQDGSYTIIDYKTGSSFGYQENNYFNGGRKLQHGLYALAFETLFSHKGAKVSKSIYFFPTLKGQGERVVRHHGKQEKENFLKIVDYLCELLKEGHFPYTDDEKDCTFCAYKDVCSRHSYDKEVLDKKSNDKQTQLHLQKEVRSFD